MNLVRELQGVVVAIRRNLEMVETDNDKLETIRLITHFANKVIWHMTKGETEWDARLTEYNARVMSVGLATPADAIHKLYLDSIELYLAIKQFLEKVS